MTVDVTPDVSPETETGVGTDDLVKLAINIGFYGRPLFIDPDDSASEPAVQVGPPFVRFPVQLSPKDARIFEQLLASPIAFVAFEVQNTDGKPGYYRLVTTN